MPTKKQKAKKGCRMRNRHMSYVLVYSLMHGEVILWGQDFEELNLKYILIFQEM